MRNIDPDVVEPNGYLAGVLAVLVFALAEECKGDSPEASSAYAEFAAAAVKWHGLGSVREIVRLNVGVVFVRDCSTGELVAYYGDAVQQRLSGEDLAAVERLFRWAVLAPEKSIL